MKNHKTKTVCVRCGNKISDGDFYPVSSIEGHETGEVLCHDCAKVIYNIYNPMNCSG